MSRRKKGQPLKLRARRHPKVDRVRTLTAVADVLDRVESLLLDAAGALSRIDGKRLRVTEAIVSRARAQTNEAWWQVVSAKNRTCGVRP